MRGFQMTKAQQKRAQWCVGSLALEKVNRKSVWSDAGPWSFGPACQARCISGPVSGQNRMRHMGSG